MDPAAVPAFLQPTRWPGFHEIASGHWAEVEPLLKSGRLYLQDPGTRRAVELLAPQPGESVLDACAAPGGKSLLLADAMRTGTLVAFDLPGPRIARLKENLARVAGVEVALVQGDLMKGAAGELKAHGLPAAYAGVLVDAPCSNTGVMRHRVDVKWRLRESDFRRHARQQLSLLHAAARLVAPGGRLVYSTCSLDVVENEEVVAAFLGSPAAGAFRQEAGGRDFPWDTGHDGAGAFLLRRDG